MEGLLLTRGYLPSSIILETISLVNMFFKIFKKLATWVWWQTRAVKTWVLVLAWNNLSIWKSFKPIWFGLMGVWKIQTQNHTNISRKKKKKNPQPSPTIQPLKNTTLEKQIHCLHSSYWIKQLDWLGYWVSCTLRESTTHWSIWIPKLEAHWTMSTFPLPS